MKQKLTMLLASTALLLATVVFAQTSQFTATLTTAQETTPPTGDVANAQGSATLTIDAANMLTWNVSFEGLTGELVGAHIHAPAEAGADAPVVVDLLANSVSNASPLQGTATVTDEAVITAIRNGQAYFNLHTETNPGGEIRGQITAAVTATDFTLIAAITVEQEVPAPSGVDNASVRGSAAMRFDEASNTLFWSVFYTGLSGDPVGAHIHGPAARGETADIVVDLIANSGGNSVSPIEGQAEITDQAIIDALRGGQTYVNIHTETNPAGEIRGQLEQPVDFTSSVTLSAEQVPGELSGETGAATGQGQLSYDAASNILSWNVSYEGLTGPATVAHIHGPALAGETEGVLIDIAPDLGAPTSPLTGSATPERRTLAHIVAGLTYFNIHTEANPAGEIRAQIELDDPVELPDLIFENGFEATDNTNNAADETVN